MSLTYAGAQEFVNRIYLDLRTQFRLPACFVAGDEPPGDFGIAHFHGLTDNGCANLTFDNDRIPWEYTVKHEIGHALSALWNGGSSAGPMHEAWWKARGFPGTAWEAQEKAIAIERVTLNGGYVYWPEEAFADTFSVVNMTNPPPQLTYGYGVPLDRAKMLDFYKSLGDDMAFKDDPDAQAFAKDVKDSLNAIKAVLATHAHHQHTVNGTVTGEPVEQ